MIGFHHIFLLDALSSKVLWKKIIGSFLEMLYMLSYNIHIFIHLSIFYHQEICIHFCNSCKGQFCYSNCLWIPPSVGNNHPFSVDEIRIDYIIREVFPPFLYYFVLELVKGQVGNIHDHLNILRRDSHFTSWDMPICDGR